MPRARLARRGAGVTALLLAPDRAHPGRPRRALRAAGGTVLDAAAKAAVETVGRADLVMDGIVGIGGRAACAPARPNWPPPRTGLVVAVDLPSGVDADSGEVHGEAVDADATVSVRHVQARPLIDPAHGYAGALRQIDIGLELPPRRGAVGVAAVRRRGGAAARPTGESDKYRRGVVGVVAGSARYPGAAVLAVAGALHGGGRGRSVTWVPRPTRCSPGRRRWCRPVRRPRRGRVQSWVLGPGLGDDAPGVGGRPGVGRAGADRRGRPPAGGRGGGAGRTAPPSLTPARREAAALLGSAWDEVESRRLSSVRESWRPGTARPSS